jgi:hypothetical protein
MISAFLFYSLYPTLVALLCLLLLHKAYRSGAGLPYLKLFANLALINICQAISYAALAFSLAFSQYMADLYLISAYFLFVHFIQMALYLSEDDRGSWPKYLYIAPIILTLLHFSGLMVDSYRMENGVLLHNDGFFAWAFDVFVILSSVITIITFTHNFIYNKNNELIASKNMIALISFIPFVLISTLLIVLSNTQHVMSVVIIIPSITVYIIATFYYISTYKKTLKDIFPAVF